MPTPTYELIATTTLLGNTDQVVFGSLPQTYRDLVIISNLLSTGNDYDGYIRFNSDSGSNYSRVYMYGNGSSAVSGAVADNASFIPRTTVGALRLQVMDYSATDKHKTWLSMSANASDLMYTMAGRWANTAAVTTITLLPASTNWASGATFALYGIAS